MRGDVEFDGRPVTVALGLRRVDALRASLGEQEQDLFLDRPDQAPTPLSSLDHVLLRGGERLTTRGPPARDVPLLSPSIRATLNGRPMEFQHAKATGLAIKANDSELPHGRLFVESVDGADVEISDDLTIVVQEADVYFVVPPCPDGGAEIDLEECGKHERRPPRGHKYRIRVDGSKHAVGSATIAGAEILALVGKNDRDWSLNEKLHGGRRARIGPEQEVDLRKLGVERFETVRRQAQQGHG